MRTGFAGQLCADANPQNSAAAASAAALKMKRRGAILPEAAG